ncbi:hypothetical protein ACFV14_26870 [Streptomyces zaomyceticus]|uniref:hypothetical protein n=1 Tax=Streptomyces zaomyceticus TaxID=68286 RepID=UPI003682BC7A
MTTVAGRGKRAIHDVRKVLSSKDVVVTRLRHPDPRWPLTDRAGTVAHELRRATEQRQASSAADGDACLAQAVLMTGTEAADFLTTTEAGEN